MMDQFQVLGGSISTIKQNAFSLNVPDKHSIDNHFGEVIVLGFSVVVRRINTVVNRIEVFLRTCVMHQTD